MQKPPSTKVGDIYISRGGEKVVVSEYITSKKMKVKFEDGAEINTMQVNLKRGSFKHPMRNKFKDGYTFKNKFNDTAIVLKTHASNKIELQWTDGQTSFTDFRSIKELTVRHPTNYKVKVGEIFHVNYDNEDVEVIEFIDVCNIVVRFKDGATVKTSKALLQKGSVRHPNKGVRLGQKFKTNSGYEGTVVKYISAHNVDVLWQDGSVTKESSGNIKTGGIKPPMQPSLCGVGFFGIGKYESFQKVKSLQQEKLYAYWTRMISRCYDPYEMNKPKGASYREAYVDSNWHNFQNFALWAETQYNTLDFSFELDKDLLFPKGNKLYYENNCCFLPFEINVFLMKQPLGKYGRGVHIIKPSLKSPNASIGYVSKLNKGTGNRLYLGFHTTKQGAFNAYKLAKESFAKELAEKWKDKIDPRAYEALMNYTVEITD